MTAYFPVPLGFSDLFSSSGTAGIPNQSLPVPFAGRVGTSLDHLLLLNNLLGKSAEASAFGFCYASGWGHGDIGLRCFHHHCHHIGTPTDAPIVQQLGWSRPLLLCFQKPGLAISLICGAVGDIPPLDLFLTSSLSVLWPGGASSLCLVGWLIGFCPCFLIVPGSV